MQTTIIVLVAYVVMLLFIAFIGYKNISNFSDFFIAGRKGSYIAITGSLLATILGGSAIIGSVDESLNIGWASSWYMLCASLGLFALYPLANRVSRLGKYTLPEMLGDMYNSRVKNISSFIIPIAWLGITSAQIIASAKILQSFANINYTYGVLITGLVFIIYTIAGGQFSILKTDFIQALLIIIGLLIISFFLFKTVTIPFNELTVLSFPFNIHFSPLDLFILIITYSTTFLVGPDIYSRIFCSKDEKIAKKSVLTAAIILVPVALVIGFIGVSGNEITHTTKGGSVLIDVIKNVLPTWSVSIIVIALLSAVLSSADTTILSASIMITDLIEKGKFGSKSLLKTRFVILIIGSVSMIISIHFTSIIGIFLVALTVYSGAFILPVLAGLFRIDIKPRFVMWAMLLGGSVALVGKILTFSMGSHVGNLVIISSFAVNALFLFLGKKKPLQK
jgi:solute:Na+ symporter, SSS family